MPKFMFSIEDEKVQISEKTILLTEIEEDEKILDNHDNKDNDEEKVKRKT